MTVSSPNTFGNQLWYRKAALIVLLPIVLPTMLLVLLVLVCLAACAVAANYMGEIRVRWQMRRHGRSLSFSDAADRIAARGGTLIIENPSLGWNFTHAWWTPDDVLAKSPFTVPSREEYKEATEKMQCPEWDRWCWDNYTSLEAGSALLLRVWNGASIERRLRSRFTDLPVVHTWTALVHFQQLRQDLKLGDA